MALDDFDLATFLQRMKMHFGGGGPQAPAWMTNPHKTITAQAEPTSEIPQVGGVPWYAAVPKQSVGPAAGFGDEPENDQLTSFLMEGQGPDPKYSVDVGEPQMPPQYDVQVGEPSMGGIQGPQMGDIQIQQGPGRHIQMPPLTIKGHRDGGDDPETLKRKAALASMGGP